jgi:HAMP domain-containing protein
MRKTSSRWKLRTWRQKLLALLLTFSILPLLLLAARNYVSLRSAFEHSNLESLQGLARSRAAAIDGFTEDRRSEVERIAGLLLPTVMALEAERQDAPAVGTLPELRDADALGTDEPPEMEEEAPEVAFRPSRETTEAQAALRQALSLVLWDQRRFEELMVIDAEGRVIASTFQAHEQRSVATRGYFRQGLGRTHIERLFVSPVTDRLTLIVSTPIRDPARGVVGVLAARLNLETFFRLINDVTGLGATGETVVVRRIGDEAVFRAPTRHDPEAALQRRVPLDAREGQALQEAVRGRQGAGEVLDYRGERVLAAWEHVPSLEWGLVVKQDKSELLQPVRDAALHMVVLLLVVVGGVVAASLVASQALVRPLRELERAADRISRGDLDVELTVYNDEKVGELADSFQRMVAAIKFFRRHARTAVEEDTLLDEDAEL